MPVRHIYIALTAVIALSAAAAAADDDEFTNLCNLHFVLLSIHIHLPIVITTTAPAQLPSSFERYEANDSDSNHASNSSGRGDSRVDKLYTYITALLKIPIDNVTGILPSVRSLYHIKMSFDDPCIIIVDHIIISAALGGYAFGSNKGADPGNTSTPLMIGSAMGPRGILNENRVAWKSVQSSIGKFRVHIISPLSVSQNACAD